MFATSDTKSKQYKCLEIISISIFILLLCSSILWGQEFWQKTNGPNGGYVSAFAVNSKGEIFASTRDAFIYLTKDFGQTWQAIDGPNAPQYMRVMVINANDVIFGGSSQLQRSMDNGQTWQNLNMGVTNFNVSAMVINPSGHIFAGSFNNGIFRSMDNGDSWTPVNIGLSIPEGYRVAAITVNKSNAELFAAMNNRGIFYSNNNGESWTLINSTIPNTSFSDLEINAQGDLFVTTSTDGIFKSTDNGYTWTPLTNGISLPVLYTLCLNSSNQLFTAGANGEIYFSSDKGASWTRIDHNFTFNPITNLFTYGSSYVFAGTSQQGIFISSNNGNTWQEKNAGFNNTIINDLIKNSDKQIFAAVHGDGVFLSNDFGDTWQRMKKGLEFGADYVYDLLLRDNDDMYAATSDGIFLSTDQGQNWHSMNNGSPGTSADCIIMNKANDYLYAGFSGGYGVYKSTDWGVTWIPANRGMNLDNTTVLTSMACASNGTLYAGTNDWIAPKGIYRSVDGGDNWIQINNGLSDLRINAMAINQEGYLFALTGNAGLFRSIDGGDNWHQLFDGNAEALAFNSAGHLFLSAYNGVTRAIFRSVDHGINWNFYGHGLPYRPAKCLLMDETDNIYAGLDAAGVYKGLVSTTIKNPNLISPVDNALAQPLKPTLQWQSVSAATAYQLQVSTKIDFSTLGFDESGLTVTEREITGLKHDTRFFWRVRAYNEFSMSPWSEPWSFVTLKEGPLLNLPANNQTQMNLSINFTWNSVSDTDYYNLLIGLDPEFNQIFENMNTPNLNQVIDNLSYSTKYFWKVRAHLSDGFTDWSETRNFSTKLGPPPLVNPPNFATDLPIALNFRWTTLPSAENYWLQVSENSGFTVNHIDKNNLEANEFFYDNFDFKKTYYWRVAGFANGDWGEWSELWRFTTASYPESYALDHSLNFPSFDNPADYKSTDYRLFGLPGNSNLTLEQVFGDGAGNQWIAYWDNGESNNYFIKYSADNNLFHFVTGRAFWIIFKGQLTINRAVTSPTLNSEKQAELPLHKGWNLISNPFNKTIPWSVIQENNGLSGQPLWTFSGSFNQSGEFQPNTGYYYDNTKNDPSLKIPYQGTLMKVVEKAETDWQIRIILTSDGYTDASTWFGVSASAETGIDALDYRKPRALGQIPMVYFDRSEWEQDFACLASDIRPPIQIMELWDFNVQGMSTEMAQLEFLDLTSVPGNLTVCLIDRVNQKHQNLRQNNIYPLNSSPGQRKFSVIVGTESAVEERLKEIKPLEFQLGKNYPNPFNPATKIPVQLAALTEIRLTIYDLLGAQIKNLYEGSIQAGSHIFIWDGSNAWGEKCPSGVYLYQLRTKTGLETTRKMLLIK